MLNGIKIEYPEHYLAEELKEWTEYMSGSKKISDALDELRTKRAFHLKRAEEMNALIRGLESLTSNGDEQSGEGLSVRNGEFMDSGIAEAAVIMIRRANRPLHVREIADGLKAGGYHFKTTNPTNSVAPVLYMASEKEQHGIIKKPKNTYSLKEIEDRTIQ